MGASSGGVVVIDIDHSTPEELAFLIAQNPMLGTNGKRPSLLRLLGCSVTVASGATFNVSAVGIVPGQRQNAGWKRHGHRRGHRRQRQHHQSGRSRHGCDLDHQQQLDFEQRGVLAL